MATKARYDPTNLFQRNQNIPPAIKRPGQWADELSPIGGRLGILQLGAIPA
jgi:hypothetical protein